MFFDFLPSLLNELILSKIIEERYLRKKKVVIYRKEDLKYYFLQTGKELNTRLEDVLEINLPKGITSLGDRVFSYCKSLVNIELPEGITSLGNSVFSYCTSLVNIELPNSITSLGNSVFEYCTSLVNIKLSEGITSLGYDVFDGCINLKTIRISENSNFSKDKFPDKVKIIKY